MLGSRTYYPATQLEEDETSVLDAFIPQFYLSGRQTIPQEIVVSHKPNDAQLLCDTLMEQGKRKVVIKTQVRDARALASARKTDS